MEKKKDEILDSVNPTTDSSATDSVNPTQDSIDSTNLTQDSNNPSDLIQNLDNFDLSPSETPAQTNLDSFAQDVLSALIDKNIPPLPMNFQAFFEQMLDSQDLDFQKKIYDSMEIDKGNEDRNIAFEKSIHAASAIAKDILKCTSAIYKNFILIAQIEQKWLVDLRKEIKSDSAWREIQALQKTIDSQTGELRALYQKCAKALENVQTNTMYDSKFDVFNKRYFIQCAEEEQEKIKKFKHHSTILMLTLPAHITQYLNNNQSALFIMKTVAKLLLKTSRRSDIIGYIGNGIFGMMLKHSDIFSSKKASERLIDLLKNTNMFIGSSEINLDLNIGISLIKPERSTKDSLNFALGALRLAQQNKHPYEVFKDDKDD